MIAAPCRETQLYCSNHGGGGIPLAHCFWPTLGQKQWATYTAGQPNNLPNNSPLNGKSQHYLLV